MMKRTFFDTPVLSTLLRFISVSILKIRGWKTIGEIPEDMRKVVVIAAPHTSNWDLPLSLMCSFVLRRSMRWMGKETIFKFPFKTLMRWMGGISVDRSKVNNMVQATIEAFKKNDKLVVVIPPEGTRKKAAGWKTGFYYIARGADVPIVCCFLDYKKKEGGVGLILHPGDSFEDDMKKIKAFYSTITGKYSDNFTVEP